MKRVREDMGLTNVKLMIPFCRTVAEGKRVIELMAKNGLKQGKNGTEIGDGRNPQQCTIGRGVRPVI
ncbi:hypothetical protein [Mucilaginibacter humi]|uniref:hypothetical protein n=1 Tax=Mucilaginibacter humi TaxID=2732510 RepID=UPI001C2E441B|nr:hypothetical protein [Mucilaginibacter humi]